MALAAVLTIHDESQTIIRALDSLAKIADPIIGLDVGSTDGAAELARDFGVEVHEQEWTTHGAANETLLRLARGRADYVFFGAATETVEQTGPLPEPFEAPLYLVPCWRHGIMFANERVFDTTIEWTCPGPVHSTIQPHFMDERRDLFELVVTQHDDDGRRPGKLRRYRDELEAWLAANPHDARSVYYLAQTYYHLGNIITAGGLYKRRAEMSNGDVEAWHALYMAGVCDMMTSDFVTGAELLLQAARMRPDRMEPHWTLEAACHAMRQQHTPPQGLDVLFLNPDAYLGEDVANEQLHA